MISFMLCLCIMDFINWLKIVINSKYEYHINEDEFIINEYKMHNKC